MLRLHYSINRMRMTRYQDEENFNFVIKFENEKKLNSIFVSKLSWKMKEKKFTSCKMTIK